MIVSNRFDTGRFAGGRFRKRRKPEQPTSFTVILSGLTDNTVHGPTAQIGTTLSAETVGAPNATVAPLNWQWHLADSPIPGATAQTYMPAAGDDLAALHVVATPSDGGPPVASDACTVRHAPPIAIGPIRDRRMTWNSEERRINGNIGRKFAGEELVLSATGYAGAYVDGTAFYIDPHTLTDGRIVTVSATNSGGTATVDFELIVVAE